MVKVPDVGLPEKDDAGYRDTDLRFKVAVANMDSLFQNTVSDWATLCAPAVSF